MLWGGKCAQPSVGRMGGENVLSLLLVEMGVKIGVENSLSFLVCKNGGRKKKNP